MPGPWPLRVFLRPQPSRVHTLALPLFIRTAASRDLQAHVQGRTNERLHATNAVLFSWFVSRRVREEVLLAGLCERKILFRLKIYDRLRQATAKRTGRRILGETKLMTHCIV